MSDAVAPPVRTPAVLKTELEEPAYSAESVAPAVYPNPPGRKPRLYDGLTLQEITFLKYFIDINNPKTFSSLKESAKAANLGTTERSHEVLGARVMHKPAVAKFMRKIFREKKIEVSRAITRLWAQATFDPAEAAEWGEDWVRFRPSAEMPLEARWGVAKIKGVETLTPFGPKRTLEMSFHKPIEAVALLAKIMKWVEPDTLLQVNNDNRKVVNVHLRGLTDEQLDALEALARKADELGIMSADVEAEPV